MIYDNLYSTTSEIIKNFWRSHSSETVVKHVACAANPDASNIVGISTDGKDFYFNHYERKDTQIKNELQTAKEVLQMNGKSY